MAGCKRRHVLASGAGAGGAAPIPGRCAEHGLSLISDRQWVSVHVGCLHEGVCNARDDADIHEPKQLKGNADTERLMRRLKEELLWLRDWTSPLELERTLVVWVDCYNMRYLHSAIGHRTPCQVEQQYLTHSAQAVAA